MNGAGSVLVAVLLLACSARPPATARPAHVPVPVGSTASATPPPRDGCRAERVLSLARFEAAASGEVSGWFLPDLVARSGAPELDDVARAVLNAGSWQAPEVRVDVCWDRGRPGIELDRATAKSDRVRVFDLQRVQTTSDAEPRLAVLSSSDALKELLAEGTAHFELALLDAQYRLLSRTAFETVRPAERTLDGVGAFLKLEHGLVTAHVRFGCPAEKYSEHFDVPIAVGKGSCVEAEPQTFPPEQYSALPPSSSCRAVGVARAEGASLPSYEATHGTWSARLAMPYVADDSAAWDADWLRIAMILAPSAPEPPPTLPAETLENAVAVGSLEHTTARWSFVQGDQLRLHQLVPVVTPSGREGFLALYARSSPRDLLEGRSRTWRVALLSPAYQVEAEVAFEVSPPGHARYRALQTALSLVGGQPVARLRYRRAAPEPGDDAKLAPGDWEDSVPLSLDLDGGCLARAPG